MNLIKSYVCVATIKKVLFILFLALVVRIVYAWFFIEADSLILEDQRMYIQLGKAMAKTGDFLQPANNGYTVVTDRVPGYPALLAIVYTLFGENNMNVVAIQVIIDSLTCVIIALITRLIIPGGFMVAGVVSALNLSMIVLSGMILTDTLFLFIFSLFILCMLYYLRDKTKFQLFLTISLLCIATLVRPVSYYLIFLLVPLLIGFFIWRKIPIKQAMYSLVMYMIIAVIAFGSIHYQNYNKYNSLSLVSQGGKHAIYWVVPATYQYSGQGSYQEGHIFAKSYVKRVMDRDNLESFSDNPFERSEYYMRAAKESLADLGLLNILHAWSAGAVINLLTPSAIYAPVVRAMEHPSFYATIGDGTIEKLFNYIVNTNGLLYLSIMIVGTIMSLVFLIFTMLGIYRMIKSRWFVEIGNREALIFFLFVVIYFIAITGPIVGVKYRLPIEPIMTVFFSYTLVGFRRSKLNNNKQQVNNE